MVSETFGQYARKCRKQARVSLYVLGKATGLAPVQIQAVERNEAPPPPLPVLQSWADSLNVPADVFISRAGRAPAPADG